MVTISSVLPGSPAEKAGVRAHDQLVMINASTITDVLDYQFYLTDPVLDLSLLRSGRPLTVRIEKEEYEDIGLEFDTFLMDRQRSCENHCVFCFIDQNPSGMRESVYFKDDDTRLSFLHGNYVTLTNCDENELERIARLRLSPVNVSVHATEPELRALLLQNDSAGRILEQLRFLASRGIALNCQLVLCRGINDGGHLTRTLTDLSAIGDAILSIAVVPAGLTMHREGLFHLRDYDEESAGEVIDLVDSFERRRKNPSSGRLCFCADEFYLRAHRPLPGRDYYGDYPQLDNGVGLLRALEEDVEEELARRRNEPYEKKNYLLLTGTAAAPFFESLTQKIVAALPGVRCSVCAVENRFYGKSVTVAGLLTGSDYLAAVRDLDLLEFDAILLSASSLRYERDLFLDGMSLTELKNRIGLPIIPVEGRGDLAVKLMGGH